MCQRVGFARALVVEPDILLMDEPFSALDVLTAENLRSDLLDLWHARKAKNQTSGMVFVTHNIEEAAVLADRIILFDSDPGCVRSEMTVSLPHPRDEQSPRFRKLVDDIYTSMTSQSKMGLSSSEEKYQAIGIGYRLPDVDVSELIGLLETIESEGDQDRMDLPELAESTQLDIDELFPLTEALEMFRFAQVLEGDIHIMPAGKRFIELDMLAQKPVFARHLIRYIPLARHIRQVLDARDQHTIDESAFLKELATFLSEDEAERVLRVAIDWGRYAEIFAYDYNTGILSLENPS